MSKHDPDWAAFVSEQKRNTRLWVVLGIAAVCLVLYMFGY